MTCVCLQCALQRCTANRAATKNAQLMDCWMAAQFNMLQSLLNSSRERIALGAQWGTDRDCITPFKTLKHTYYEEAGGYEMWKQHQMDTTTESHHTSYSVPAGHPLISCVCFSSLVGRREEEHNNKKTAAYLSVKVDAKNTIYRQYIIICMQYTVLPLQSEFLEAFRLFCQMSWHFCHRVELQYKVQHRRYFYLPACVQEQRSCQPQILMHMIFVTSYILYVLYWLQLYVCLVKVQQW